MNMMMMTKLLYGLNLVCWCVYVWHILSEVLALTGMGLGQSTEPGLETMGDWEDNWSDVA